MINIKIICWKYWILNMIRMQKKAQEQLSNGLQLEDFKEMIRILKQIQLEKSLKQFVLFVNEIRRDFYKKK